MNILIQGAASHVHLSAHHSVKEKLDAVDPELVNLYDLAIAGATLAYWDGLIRYLYGRGMRFWTKLHHPKNPFFHHRFLRRHGKLLATNAYDAAVARCREKQIIAKGWALEKKLAPIAIEILEREMFNQPKLQSIAKDACLQIIDIPRRLLNAEITLEPKWGDRQGA